MLEQHTHKKSAGLLLGKADHNRTSKVKKVGWEE